MTLPSSTYRVQLHAGFNFRQLEDILDYLHELGITALYVSPITQALAGSQHGYDVSAPESLNPEIGTESDLERLSRRCKEYGMSWLQDIVPNHMAYDQGNPWLYDVLERGKASEYYSFFDIDTALSRELTGDRIMAPFLGSLLAESLQKKELRLEFSDKGFVIRYYDKDYPVAISAYRWICSVREDCPAGLSEAIEWIEKKAADASASEWNAAKEHWLEELGSNSPWISYIGECLPFFNEQSHVMGELLNKQHYVLEHAQLAASQINYRRFFTVNSLICIRMEEESVFSAWHRKILDWYEKGYIQGLRIDHIDGLAGPGLYIRRLRAVFGEDTYIVAEKILAAGEPLPADWELEGTTGYEFLAFASQLFTDPEGFSRLKKFYLEKIAPDTPEYEDLVFEKKYHFLKTKMGGELNNLLHFLFRLERPDGGQADKERLKEALAILMASFPVYRLYPEIFPLPETGRAVKERAFRKARQNGNDYARELDILELSLEDTRFFTRLMQFTGPLAAKGIEDTTFYVYNPLISRNEVGDTPAKEGLTIAEFHKKMAERLNALPGSLNAGSTHDTKRGEDSRIRLNFLSSMAEEWIKAVTKWKEVNTRFVHAINGQAMPSGNDEYFIYQSLLGALPPDLTLTESFNRRFHAFLTKALREADTNTHYDSPNVTYEKKCHEFVEAILAPGSLFLETFLPLAGRIIERSMTYSMAQLLLRLTAPGIPDIYQGAECWELSLVDPDNRRSVDFELRKYLLKRIKEEEEKGWSAVKGFIDANNNNGAGKLFMLYKVLAWRKQFPDLFARGNYIPLATPDHLLAYLRRDKGNWAMVAIPLIRSASLFSDPGWFCKLPADAPLTWINAFTGDTIRPGENGMPLSGLFEKFPAVLLTAHT
jgi:(1->4)-alpha-D-glucan 1-alpha-D-glucosylmutase